MHRPEWGEMVLGGCEGAGFRGRGQGTRDQRCRMIWSPWLLDKREVKYRGRHTYALTRTHTHSKKGMTRVARVNEHTDQESHMKTQAQLGTGSVWI